MNKVLILGINGFTGRHFQDYIVRNRLEECYSFTGADRKIERIIGIDYREVNLLEKDNLQQLIREVRPSYIINFMGVFESDDVNTMLEANAGFSRRILNTVVMHDLPVKNILLIGSAAEYGTNSNLPLREESPLCPVTFYGLSKVIQTQYALYYNRNFGINVNVARTFNIIGKGMSISLSIPIFMKQILESEDGGSIYVGNLHTKRDFLNISDVVDAYWKIVLGGRGGLIYNVCRGSSNRLKDIIDYMIKKSGKKLNVVVKDDYVKKNDILDSYGSHSKLSEDTEWNCLVSVYESIDKLFDD